MGLGVVLATADQAGPLPTEIAGPTVPPTSRGYLVSVSELRDRAMRAAAGEQPDVDAMADLLDDAERLVGHVPEPVEPLRIADDGGPFEADGSAAYALALAYRTSGDERFGRSAARILTAWMDSVTRVEDICRDSGACHTSLIVSRLGASFVFAADLLDGTPVWSGRERTRFAGWLEQVILPAASERTNNWGDAGTLLRVAITDFVGDTAGFERALGHWRALMDLVESDGTIPEEARRGALGLQYTQEALQYKVAVAEIAGRRGVDLWSYEGSRGGSLKAAIDLLARTWSDPDRWPHDPAVVVPRPGPMWELAYAHWQDPAWVSILTERRPYGDLGHSALRWVTLTNGIPTTVAAGPGSSPEVTPTPAATATPEPTLGEPRLRVAAVPARGLVDVGLTWPVVGSAGGAQLAIGIERSIGGGPFEAVGPAGPAGQEIAIAVPLDETIRLRAAIVETGAANATWVDGPAIVVRILDDTSPAMSLDGSWSPARLDAYVGGTAASSKARGAVATVTIDGYAMMLFGPVGPTRGRFSASFDGAEGTEIDTYRSRFEPAEPLVVATWATAGRHTLLLRVLGAPAARPTVGLDAIVVIEAAR